MEFAGCREFFAPIDVPTAENSDHAQFYSVKKFRPLAKQMQSSELISAALWVFALRL